MSLSNLTEPDWSAQLAELRGHARRLGAARQDSEDAVQEALLSALRAQEGRVSVPSGWLRVVLRNAWLRMLREDRARRERERLTAEHVLLPSPIEELERTASRERLGRWIEELRSPYREVVRGRYLEERSIDELVRDLSRSPGTIRAQLSRGLEQLRVRLRSEQHRHGVWSVLPWGIRAVFRRVPAWGLPGALGLLVGIGALVGLMPRTNSAGGRSLPAHSEPTLASASADVGERTPLAPTAARQALPLTPEALGGLTVHATRTDAGSVDGFELRLAPFDERRAARRARTGPDGLARFDELEPGPWRLQPQQGSPRVVVVESGAEQRIELEVQGGRSLLGRVVPLDEGFEETRIWGSLPGSPDDGVELGGVDAKGEFWLEDLDPMAWIWAVNPRLGASSKALVGTMPARAGGGSMVRLVLAGFRPASTRSGRILDWSGQPMANVLVIGDLEDGGRPVWRSARGFRMELGRVQTRTGADGSFELESSGAPPTTWTVVAGGLSPYVLPAPPAADRGPVEVRLPRPRTLLGRVFEADGSPAMGAWVRLQPASPFGERASVHTDRGGRFEVQGLLPGEFWMTAIDRQNSVSCARSWSLAEEEGPALELRMSSDSSISGVLEGELRADVHLELEDWSSNQTAFGDLLQVTRASWAAAGIDGRFSFPGLRQGTYRLSAFDRDGVLLGARVTSVPARLSWSIDARELASVRGYVGGLERLEDVCLGLESPALSGGRVVRVEASGRFEARGLPAGSYALTALRTDIGPEILSRFELSAGAELQLDDLALARPASALVVITCPDPLEAALCSCTLESVQSGLPVRESLARHQRNGRELCFEFNGVVPGKYALVAHLEAGFGGAARVLRDTIEIEPGPPRTFEFALGE